VVGEVILGRYSLEELVGAGGMSSVYRAHDRLLERDVALKILHESYLEDEAAVERFRREARAVAQLSHPNIVTVIDRGEEDGRQFIVFEYVPGEDLKECVARTGALPVREALTLAVEAGRGLAFAHRHGIVHRDVKPQNVMLNGDGQAKVTDFGIARSLDVEKGVTQSGTVLGTSDYISPEQASGGTVGPETDVYSLGCVLFELLTGEVPFPGGSFVAVAMRHLHEPPPSVLDLRPDVPPRVASAVERAMAKDPGARFATMEEFIAELEACLAAPGQPDAEATVVQAPARAPRRSRPRPARSRRRAVWPLVLLVAGLALLAAVAATVLLSGGVESPLVPGNDANPSQPVELTAVVSHDPYGDDGSEHPDEVPFASDGDRSTYWTTSSYRYPEGGLGKEGVGIVLDPGGPATPEQIVVITETPGFTAEVRVGDSQEGPFDTVAAEAQQVGEETTFELGDAEGRFWLVWITNRGDNSAVRINEITAR
jgi:serine/threonine protein kinase